MIEYYDFKGKCWWCGQKADSAEHRYKKADMEKEFGKGIDFRNNEPVRVVGKNKIMLPIQRPKSNNIKYKASLCQNCNTTKSQPFDFAYDTFVSFYKENENEIFLSKKLDFQYIYGNLWKPKVLDFQRYLVKNFCCRLYGLGVSITKNIVDFLNGEADLIDLKLHMFLKSDIYKMLYLPSDAFDTYLGFGPVRIKTIEPQGSIDYVYSSMYYRSLAVFYLYTDKYNNMITSFSKLPKVVLHTVDNPVFDKLVKEQLL